MRLRDYVYFNGKQYYVSTANCMDVGLESMVFESENNRVIKWTELFFKHYKTEEEAIEGHKYIISNIGECLADGKKQNWNEATNQSMEDVLCTITKYLEGEDKNGK